MTVLDETSASAFRYTPPKRLQSLSFAVLAGDTVQNVEAAISEAIEAASAVADYCEIVVVDVSTTKFVEAVVQRLARNHDIPIRLTRYEHNAGYGQSVRHAWSTGRSEWVAFTDAEYQFRLGDLADFIPLTDHADVITGWNETATIRCCADPVGICSTLPLVCCFAQASRTPTVRSCCFARRRFASSN